VSGDEWMVGEDGVFRFHFSPFRTSHSVSAGPVFFLVTRFHDDESENQIS